MPNQDGAMHGDFGVPGANGDVRSVAVRSDELFIAGRFSQVAGISATNVARWDGYKWMALGVGVGGGFFPGVFALATMGSNVFVGGTFDSAEGIAASNVARWDGFQWSALESGVNGPVRALAVLGQDLFVGGLFTSAGGLPAFRLARWKGTNWFAVAANTNATPGCSDLCFDDAAVFALAVTDRDLYVGGRFVSAGGVFATNIALWHIPHPLRAAREGDELVLSWAATGSNLTLESSLELGAFSKWLPVSPPPARVGHQLVVTQDFIGNSRFFRLGRR